MRPQHLIRGVARYSIRTPRIVILLWTLMLALASGGALQLEIRTSTESVLSTNDAAWAFYQESTEKFGGDQVIAIAFQSQVPFDPKILAEIERVTDELEGAPGVRRVDSLATLPVVRASPDGGLDLSPAMPDGPPSNAEELVAIRRATLGDRILPRYLVSEDERVHAVTVLTDALGSGHDEIVSNAVKNAIGDAPAWYSGTPRFTSQTTAWTQRELIKLSPITTALILITFFFLFGSATAALIPILSSGVTVILVLGVMGYSGVPLTLTTSLLPSILLALGCAYATHILAAMRPAQVDKPRDLESELLPVVAPIVLSGVTTALGFGAMALVRIDSIMHMGIFGSLGVVLLTLQTISLLPALVSVWRPAPPKDRVLLWIVGPVRKGLVFLVTKHQRSVVAAWIAMVLLFGIGIRHLQVETDVVLWFPRGTEIREDYESIRTSLSGISPVNIVIEAPENRRVTEPVVLLALAGLTDALEQLPEVGKAISIADSLRQLRGGFEDLPGQPVPDSIEMAEQYLMLLESVEQIHDLVTGDRQFANVVVRVDDNGSDALLAVAASGEEWWQRNGPHGFKARATGLMFEYARSQEEIAAGALRGLTFALLAVAIVLLVVLRSVKTAGLALIPNMIPLVLCYGTMGYLGIPLDAGTVLVGSLVVGIAVDDTIHLLVNYNRSSGEGSARIEQAFARCLPALTYSTVTIAIGFAALVTSGFTLTRNLGLLTSGEMLACYLADIILLPALLQLGRRDRKRDPGADEAPRVCEQAPQARESIGR